MQSSLKTPMSRDPAHGVVLLSFVLTAMVRTTSAATYDIYLAQVSFDVPRTTFVSFAAASVGTDCTSGNRGYVTHGR